MTLVELSLGMLLLTVLLLAVGAVLDKAIESFRTTDVRGQALGDLQVTLSRLAREVEMSTYDSCSVSGEAVSFLSPLDADGRSLVGPAGSPLWQKYVIWYRSAGELFRRELALPTPSESAQPIEVTLGPLPSQLTGGTRMMPLASLFTPEVPPGSRSLTVLLATVRPRIHMAPLTMEFSNRMTFRN